MNIFRVNRLPLYQAPDTPGAVAEDPALAPIAAIDAEPAPDAPVPDIQPDTPPAPEPKPDGRKNPWYLKRISDEAERVRVAEQRATDAEALAARLQSGAADPTPAQPHNIDHLVNARAAALRLNEDRGALVQAGQTAFGADAFNEAAGIAAACGCVSDEFVSDVLAVDRNKAHEIYMRLAKEPERAAQIAQMPSRQRIAELTRMTMTTPEPAKPTLAPAKQVSRAPAPPPPVEPSASKVIDGYADEATEEQFTAQFNERMAKRGGGRR